MNVAELIEFLSQQPPERRVLVDGYESGLDDIDTVSEISVVIDAYTIPQTFGRFHDSIPAECGVGDHARAKTGEAGEIAVYIKRPGSSPAF